MPDRRRILAGSPLAAAGAVLLALALLLAVAAPLLSPFPPATQLDPVAGRYLPPGSSRLAVELIDGGWLLAERARPEDGGLRLERGGGSEWLPATRIANLGTDGSPPRVRLWLGSDKYGRDLWSRVAHGARVSLAIGVLAATLALTLGVVIGGTAAMAGGWVDQVLMRLVDGLLTFPRLFLILAVTALFGSGFWLVVLVLGGTSWMEASRVVRAEIQGLMKNDYVLAARSVGQTTPRIFLRHLLPGSLAAVTVDTTLRVGELILIEATLSFLGLGVQPPQPTWGNIIAEGSEALVSAWWVSTFPGLAIVLTVLAFTLLGDGLRDVLDPKTRG